VYGTVRTVVWEDGGGNPASYPIAPGMPRQAKRGKVPEGGTWMSSRYIVIDRTIKPMSTPT